MRMPLRKSQRLNIPKDEGPLYLTPEGIEKLKRRLQTIERVELPQAIADTQRTGEFGDFSENAEYQEAKGRMRRLHTSVLSINDKLSRAVPIDKSGSDVVEIGSYVTLVTQTGEKIYQIVGPAEANPMNGRLSYRSPLGAKLMGRKQGERIEQANNFYTIAAIT